MFRRRRSGQNDEPVQAVEPDLDGPADDEPEDEPAAFVVDRSSGPWDESEAPDDGLTRLDLGGMRVAGAEGMEIRLEVDEASQNVVAVTAVLADSALQMTVFAAPRTEGIWSDVRREIRQSLAATGTVDEVDGQFGPELLASLPLQGPNGEQRVQPVRFVGVDGPRWFLRALFTGRAAREAEAAAPLEAVLRATVVVRGGDPMAPGDSIALHVPAAVPDGMTRTGAEDEDDDAVEAPDRRTPLPPPERGPEITEIR